MNRSRAWYIGIVLLSLGARANTAAQQQPTSAVSQIAIDAGTAYDGKDWAASARLYAQIVQSAPNPRAWYRLGVSLNKIGENDKAIEAFEKGRALGLPPQFVEYGIAVVFVSQKDKDKAFEHLEKAAANGLSQPDQLSADPDLAELKSDPRFATILEPVTRNQKPCANLDILPSVNGGDSYRLYTLAHTMPSVGS